MHLVSTLGQGRGLVQTFSIPVHERNVVGVGSLLH